MLLRVGCNFVSLCSLVLLVLLSSPPPLGPINAKTGLLLPCAILLHFESATWSHELVGFLSECGNRVVESGLGLVDQLALTIELVAQEFSLLCDFNVGDAALVSFGLVQTRIWLHLVKQVSH